MTIRIYLEQHNSGGAKPEGLDHPDAWLELDEGRTSIVLGFGLDRWEYADRKKAKDSELYQRSASAEAGRRVELERAVDEHRSALRLAWKRNTERVRRYKYGSANWLKAKRELDNLEVSQHEALWKILAPDDAGANVAGYHSGDPDPNFTRNLTTDEARELAAILHHYANESERPR